MQQHIAAIILAFALGASARPKAQFGGWWPFPYGEASSAFPSLPVSSGAGVSFSYFPSGSGTGTAVPTGFPTAAPTGGSSYLPPSGSVPVPAPSGSAEPSVPAPSGSAAPSVPAPSGSAAPSAPAESSYAGSAPSSLAAPVSDSSVAPSSAAAAESSAPAAGSSAAGSASAAPTVSSPPSSGGSSGGGLPASSGTSALSAAQTIAAGDSFDCGMVMYDRGQSCTGDEEGGDEDAVFILENGASLSNCIIGPNQIEGVHCNGNCQLTNVWWSAVCEDAFSIKEQAAGETTTVSGGGAFGADDKVIQHNGAGTVSISGFTVDNFGKLYRSCGNCDEMYERHVILDDITATEGSVLAGINNNYGDTATFSNINVSGVEDICVTYTGNDTGDEPEENGSGPSDACLYSESDITEI